MKRGTILVVGSSNTDMILNVARIPEPGETLLGDGFSMAAGGKGANQAVAAARAGGRVTFVARVGRDAFGRSALAGFRRDGIRVNHVGQDGAHPSGVALILVGRNGENSIAVASGANARLSATDVRRARGDFRCAAVVLLQLETPLPAVLAAAQLGAAEGACVILNPAPACELPDKLLKQVDVLTPNEREAEMLSGVKVRGATDAIRAARVLLGRGVRSVIVTLGRNGAIVADASGIRRLAGLRVRAVDTTGAGDVFNGALAVALAEGRPIFEAARFANAAAALSVTRPGAQPSAPHRREIELFEAGKNGAPKRSR